MRTQGDIITEVLVRNNRFTTDTFITDVITQSWYKAAHVWASAYKKWPFTEGKASTTFSTAVVDDMGNTVIPYFEGWKADSVRVLTIGGKRLQKVEFSSFLRYLENYTRNSTNRNNSRIFSDYSRQLYVNTGADVSGTLTAYGQYTPIIDATDYAAVSIFSDYDEEGNEAIVEKMTSYLLLKEKDIQESLAHAKNAEMILDQIYARAGDEQYGYQTKDQSMFDHFDVVRGRGFYNNRRSPEDQF